MAGEGVRGGGGGGGGGMMNFEMGVSASLCRQ